MRGNSRRPFSRLNSQPDVNHWYLFVLLGLLFLFWLYARYIERVDIPLMTDWLMRRLPVLPPAPALAFLVGFFHWKVLRHILPVLVGLYFAYDAAIVLVKVLYDLPDRTGARNFLSRLMGVAAAPSSIPEISPATLATEREETVLLRVGGPGRVIVPTGHVMVTEVNGRFQRILPAGIHALGRFEFVHAVLHLQPQERIVDNITAFSRDGIELRAALSLKYRLQMGSQTVTRENPYPYDETAVRRVAYAQTVVDEQGSVSTWEDIPVGMARGTLTGMLAGYRLDEIFYPERPGEEPFRTLNNELGRKLRSRLSSLGIDLLSVAINRLDLPDGVTDQYIDYWRSHWEAQIQLNKRDAQATAVEEMEIARAEAEIMMIQAILEGVQRARREGATAHMEEVVALRLVEALEMMAQQSQEMTPLPQALLPQLGNIRQQLGDGSMNLKLPGKSSE